MFRLSHPATDAVGAGAHRHGWPAVVAELAKFTAPQGILFDDFIERTFTYPNETTVHTEPWVGIVHHPPRMPPWAPRGGTPQEYTRTERFQRSIPQLQGLLTLSEPMAKWWRQYLSVPVVTLPYPLPPTTVAWNPPPSDLPAIWQFGWYLRNTELINQLPTAQTRFRSQIENAAGRNYAAAVATYWQANGLRESFPGVQDVPRQTDAQYDQALRTGVLITEYFDVGASTLVLEAIATGTPLICNYHPALAEYLGEDYPLFACGVRDYATMASDMVLLRQASGHLRRRRNMTASVTDFIQQLQQFLGRLPRCTTP